MPSKILYRNSDSTKHILLAFQRACGGPYLKSFFHLSDDWTKVSDNNTSTGGDLFGDNSLRTTGKKSTISETYAGLHVVGIKRNPYSRFIESLAYSNQRHSKTYTPDDLFTTDDKSSDADNCWYDQCGHNYDSCPEAMRKILWETQAELYALDDDSLVTDTMFSYENFSTEWTTFATDVLGDASLAAPQLGSRWEELSLEDKGTHLDDILDSVTSSTKTKIYNKFVDDFTLLGYTSSDWPYTD